MAVYFINISKVTDLTLATVYNAWTGDVGRRQFGTLFIIANALKCKNGRFSRSTGATQ